MTDSISKLINQSFKRNKNRKALIQHHLNGKAATYSFEELKSLAGKVYGLISQNLCNSECIGLYMQRSAEHVAAIVASLYSESPYTTINHLVTARQVCYIAHACELKVLICDNSTILKLRALSQTKEGQEALSKIHILHFRTSITLSPAHKQTIELLNEVATIESVMLAEAKPYNLPLPKEKAESQAKLILFTSGSTGNPKGVLIAEDDLVNRAVSESKEYRLRESDILLSILPFSFDVGCNQLYSSLINGCSLVLLNSWMPKDIVSTIIDYKINGVSGVPSFWLSVINSNLDGLKKVNDLLGYLTISGGDMAERDRLKLRDLLPAVKIFKTYGQTESFRSTMLLAEDFDRKHKSVGRPVDGVTLLILDEMGDEVKSGQKGQIIHQGAGVMLGYIGDADTTNRKLKVLPKNNNGAKVIFTGDLGSIDEDGFLYLHGRQDRMFKVRGNRVYPEEIETVLCVHDNILESVSSYDATEEAIIVYVRKKQGSGITEKELLKFLSARLPSYMIPNRCLLYDDFPRTASGKINVPALTA